VLRPASCSWLHGCSQREPRLSLQSWRCRLRRLALAGALPLSCLGLAATPQKRIPEGCRNGAVAAVQRPAFGFLGQRSTDVFALP